MKPEVSLIRWRRLLWLFICFACLFGLLIGRLIILMVFPEFLGPVIHGKQTWTVSRADADMEHFRLRLIDTARGQLLYRTGAAMMVGNHVHRSVQFLVGMVGKPAEWPTRRTNVPLYGRTGLEYTCNDILQGRRGGYVGQLKNPQLRPNSFFSTVKSGANVRTTIDAVWQTKSDDFLQRANIGTGAIVVLDVRTNEILAMASRAPQPNLNAAIQTYAPGSIFKLVMAAAALETHQVRQRAQFFCTGLFITPAVHMACWKRHGEETFLEALIGSCDIAFAQIGITIGPNPIQRMSERLLLMTSGLEQLNGRPTLPGAEVGNVLRHMEGDAGRLANTAIGQQDVRLSPLHGALLASAIAHDGFTKPATLVLGVEHHGHALNLLFHQDNWQAAFSPVTASFLRSAMVSVVRDPRGTAHDLYPYPVAVKTGTAELAKQRNVNAWVVGYFPLQHPEIAFAVLSAGVPSQTGHAQTHKIVRDLVLLYMQIHGHSFIK